MKKAILCQWYMVTDHTIGGYALEDAKTERTLCELESKEACIEWAEKHDVKIISGAMRK